MLGYLRFILAFFVLFSHLEKKILGLNPGVIAVVIFYLLAGHVVSHLWYDVLPAGPGRLCRFYRDRLLRIMPLYVYVAVLTLIFLILTGYGNPRFSIFRLLGNFLVIPLNYYMALDTTILTQPSWCLIPPAWSLGAELQAYLLLPLAFRSGWMKILLTAVSLGIYTLANISMINPDYFGYRLVCGVFFIFVAGAGIQGACKQPGVSFNKAFPWVLWMITALQALIFYHWNLYGPGYTRETFLGLLMGIPIITFMGRAKIRLPGNPLMGSLSYGIFLSHFLMIWVLDWARISSRGTISHLLWVVAGSILVSGSGLYLIERHIDRLRKQNTVDFSLKE